MLIVAVLVFLMLRLTPGIRRRSSPATTPTTTQIAAIRSRLGLDAPLVHPVLHWLGNVLRGDFGESFFFKRTVAELIVSRLEPTLALSVSTIVLAVAIAVPLGVLAAYKRGTLIDKVVMGFSVLGFSVPVFVIGYSLIYLFAIKLNWLPVQGYQRIGDGFGGFLQRLLLPSLTLSVIYIALIARMTRASVIDVLEEDYIRTARAKGQSELKVLFTHALRNASVPIVTVIGLGDRTADRRRGGHRERVHHPRPRPADGRRGAGARLPDRPGGDPAVLAGLRADQPGGRRRLHGARSEDPLLSVETDPHRRSAGAKERLDRPADRRRRHAVRARRSSS